jgi:peptidoglycan/LPS O-acetylase OafA/YrhL
MKTPNSMSDVRTGRRIPSLDGLRAISVSLVIYWHLSYFENGRWIATRFDSGMLGVFTFFVISGFIITLLLKKERDAKGTISLKAFYLRRAFRILPPLCFFLTGVAVLTKLGLSESSPRALLVSLSFVRNYLPSSFPTLRHLWSLSVEEQFYLVWPFLYSRLSTRNAMRVLILVIIAAPLVRLLLFVNGAGGLALEWHTESVADGLAAGCLLAIWLNDLRANNVYQKFVRSPLCMVLPIITVAAAWQFSPMLYQAVGKSVIFLSVALTIDASIQRHDSLIGRVLNLVPFVLLGKLSYSLYLWQQVFLLEPRGTHPYAWFPFNLVLSIGAAAFSYYAIEQPSLKFGRRLISGLKSRTMAVSDSPLASDGGVCQGREYGSLHVH